MLKSYKEKYPNLSTFNILIHFVIFISPLVLLLMPKDYFDTGTSICISKLIAGVECYACGMTRAVMHLIHFDFSEAWAFNRISFIVVPLLALLWVKSGFIVFKREIPPLMKKLM